MQLERGALLGATREQLEWVYFVDSGIVSLVAGTTSGRSLEVAIVGREGVGGFADALGARGLPYPLVVQRPGLAHRVRTSLLKHHGLSCRARHEPLNDYSQSLHHGPTHS